ncbi:MAG: OmpA family protein [Nitrospinae bacterium]|nr:OmpA family protein [Nitrospinota bacterium]MBF0634572.1 OmpA family protein [Nitrospinota bacterium]
MAGNPDKGDKPKIIIIRKKKRGHHDAHGGSWKVAYADFVTAMMALFLLLWLLSMVSEDKKVVLADFFKHYSVFESGQSFMPGSKHAMKETGLEFGTSKNIRVKGMQQVPTELLKENIESDLKGKLDDIKDQVLMEVTDEGLKIQIVDNAGRPIFNLGSDKPTDRAKEILKIVSAHIKDLPNPIVVEGHTDSAMFRTGEITNWELSTGRASSSRRELEANGLAPGRFDKIVGYADKQLLVKDDAFDPRNRRISLLIKSLPPEKAKKAELPSLPMAVTGAGKTQPPATPQETKKEEPALPIDRSKIIGDLGMPTKKPDFLRE